MWAQHAAVAHETLSLSDCTGFMPHECMNSTQNRTAQWMTACHYATAFRLPAWQIFSFRVKLFMSHTYVLPCHGCSMLPGTRPQRETAHIPVPSPRLYIAPAPLAYTGIRSHPTPTCRCNAVGLGSASSCWTSSGSGAVAPVTSTAEYSACNACGAGGRTP